MKSPELIELTYGIVQQANITPIVETDASLMTGAPYNTNKKLLLLADALKSVWDLTISNYTVFLRVVTYSKEYS